MKWSAHNGCTSVAVGQKILNFMTSFRYVFQTLYFCKYEKYCNKNMKLTNTRILKISRKKGETKTKVVLQKKPPKHFNIIKLTFSINVSCYHSELLLIKPLPLLQASNVNPNSHYQNCLKSFLTIW